jgi:hypothetical protein
MVRPMISRMYAVGFVAVFCLASTLASTETFGRSGGFGGRSIAIASGFHPPALRPPSLLHPRQFGFGVPPRRQFGAGVPLTVLGGVHYGPSDYIDPYDQPSLADPDATGAIPGDANPAFAYRPRCRVQTVTVPSEGGGARSINITRC